MGGWSTRTFNFLTDTMAVVIILILLCWGIHWAAQKPVFWLRGIDVEVQGNKEAVSARLVADQLKGAVTGTYFTANLDAVRDKLVDIPWVKNVSVYREWPNRLKIVLRLHRPVAVWGNDRLMAEDGTVFVANQALAEETQGPLPKIFGPVERDAEIYQRYLDFEKICKDHGYEMASLNLSELAGWNLSFKKPQARKNIEITFKASESPSEMDKKLDEILTGMPRIKDYFGAMPSKLDARYEKGFAVVKPEEEPETAEESTEGEEKK